MCWMKNFVIDLSGISKAIALPSALFCGEKKHLVLWVIIHVLLIFRHFKLALMLLFNWLNIERYLPLHIKTLMVQSGHLSNLCDTLFQLGKLSRKFSTVSGRYVFARKKEVTSRSLIYDLHHATCEIEVIYILWNFKWKIG